MKKNKALYDILGISSNALIDEIKRVYRNKVKESHPDKVAGRENEFAILTTVYEILTNPLNRNKYDETGELEHNELVLHVATVSLQDLWRTYLNKDKSYLMHTDLIKEIKIKVLETRESSKMEIENLSQKPKTIEEVRRKLKCTGIIDILNPVFDEEIENCRIQILQLQFQIVVCDCALELIKNYKYY